MWDSKCQVIKVTESILSYRTGAWGFYRVMETSYERAKRGGMNGGWRLSCCADKVSEVIKVVQSSPLSDTGTWLMHISFLDVHYILSQKGSFSAPQQKHSQVIYRVHKIILIWKAFWVVWASISIVLYISNCNFPEGFYLRTVEIISMVSNLFYFVVYRTWIRIVLQLAVEAESFFEGMGRGLECNVKEFISLSNSSFHSLCFLAAMT